MENNDKQLNGLLTGVTFILVFFLLSRTPLDADMWWHLHTGQDMWEQKRILLSDLYSYTRLGAPWVNAFWLSEIILYLLYSLGGYFALTMFVSITGALTFHIIYRRLSGNPFVKSLIVILAVLTAAPIWGPRPQIISFFFIALLDASLSPPIFREASPKGAENGGRWRRVKPRPLWILVPLFAIWANLHGGWIWGFLLLAAQIFGMILELILEPSHEIKISIWREARNLFGWSLLAALAVGLNPNGLAIWKLPFQQVNVSLQIQEWLSPDFHRLDFHPMLWMIFLLILTAPFSGKPLNWPQLIKVIGFAYLTFVAQRNIAIFAIVAFPLLSDWTNSALQTMEMKDRLPRTPGLNPRLTVILNAMILISLTAGMIGNSFLISQPARVDGNYPVKAIDWIKANHPNGNLFNTYNWGGYILWNLPEYPVFIDGRADLYGSELIGQWHDVVQGRENALQILDDWKVNIVLLEPGWPIIRILELDGWKIAYRDEKSVVFLR
jgi:hypothetical protein